MDTYADRIFAFNHFSISRTPEQNARMLLSALPDHRTIFDVVTHGRGGLVLRNLVERSKNFGDLSSRFQFGRAVLVASPNEGTPLATPKRWDETIGWLANLLELLPDNPFTTGAAFVANGLVWLANHASGDLPGLSSMDAEGDMIRAIQGPPGPPSGAYSALVANYQPTDTILHRLVDVGIDQFFSSANDLVVPSEGGWRIDRSSATFIPATRIGCFGPGGNLPSNAVTHANFFSQAETVDFLVNGLLGRQQPLNGVDPRKSLPDRRLVRGAMTDAPVIQPRGKARSQPAESTRRRAAADHRHQWRPDVRARGAPARPLSFDATDRNGKGDGWVGWRGHEAFARHGRVSGIDRLASDLHQHPPESRARLLHASPQGRHHRRTGRGGEAAGRGPRAVRASGGIAWAQRLAEHKQHVPPFFTLASALLGSGGTGVTAGEAARLIAQGVSEANAVLTEHASDAKWPRVNHLHFIELYLDRAADAWRALRLQEAATPGRYEIVGRVMVGTGPLQRPPDSGYRGVGYDFINVETKEERGGEPEISFTLDTKRARSEVRGQRTQSALLRDLVATASSDQNRDQQIGRTLFNLLIPVELEAYLASSGEMVIALDSGTAKIPWELLDRDSQPPPPWAIRVKLLRKLRIARFREHVTYADTDAGALVIGEPACPKEYPRLFGARSEALAVRGCLTGNLGLDVTDLISDDPSQPGSNARDVVNALFEKPWRIVHISGHGMPGENGKPGGVVLSNGTFLGPDEFRNMRTVPELVFLNCCHLAAGDADQLLKYDRASFASGVAGALIEIGVRCVVAAGWAVDDEAASMFAEAFYGSLLRMDRFIDAVDKGRQAAYESKSVNTWAAYQAYGDPDWVFRRKAQDVNQATAPSIEDFSGVASLVSLKFALERIAVQTKFQGADPTTQLNNLRKLETLAAEKEQWGKNGAVAELFGEAFIEAGDTESGIQWYEKAATAPDGKASMKAAEQLANVRGRLGWEIVDKAMRHLDEMKKREKAGGQTSKGRAAARRASADAERSLRQAVGRADTLIEESIALLTKLIAVQPTMERASLIGSAYKRRALVNGAAGRRTRVQQALRQMKTAYEDARAVGEKSGASDLYYPASNCLAADVALNAGTRRWNLDRESLRILRKSLQAKSTTDPDFWSVVGEIELDQYEALARRNLAAARKQLDKAYEDLHKRVTATRMWASVYDTACLVLPNYASRATGKERAAAHELLAHLRMFAHQNQGERNAQ